MASTDWVFCTIRTELLRCILPKFSLDTAYKRRGQSIPRDDGCRRHKPTIILFNQMCSFFYWERISDLPTWKNVELLTQNMLSPQLTGEGSISCLLCHTKSHHALSTVLSIKPKHFPLLRNHLWHWHGSGQEDASSCPSSLGTSTALKTPAFPMCFFKISEVANAASFQHQNCSNTVFSTQKSCCLVALLREKKKNKKEWMW